MTKRGDSDKDISDKLNKLIWQSEKQAKKQLQTHLKLMKVF